MPGYLDIPRRGAVYRPDSRRGVVPLRRAIGSVALHRAKCVDVSGAGGGSPYRGGRGGAGRGATPCAGE
eukprot:scaffold4700_cov32-Tisochrysis_lutea.AAC.3